MKEKEPETENQASKGVEEAQLWVFCNLQWSTAMAIVFLPFKMYSFSICNYESLAYFYESESCNIAWIQCTFSSSVLPLSSPVNIHHIALVAYGWLISSRFHFVVWVVDAASDGLKAWEILNRRSHNIDLILTEVEVPSISGFSLLSLVTEHEVCRNIPVISKIYQLLASGLVPLICFKFLIQQF